MELYRVCRGIMCLAGVSLLASCGRDHPADFSAIALTSARAPVTVLPDSLWTTGLLERDSLTFGRIRDVKLKADPREGVWVLDQLSQQVHDLGDEGEAIAVLGGRGAGPGEFSGALELFALDAGVRVIDGALWRVTEMHRDSNSEPATTPLPPLESAGWPLAFEGADDGSWTTLVQGIPVDAAVPGEARLVRSRGAFARASPGDAKWDTLALVSGMEAAIVPGPGGRMGLAEAPLPTASLWATGASGSIWVVDNRDPQVVLLGASGDTMRSITLPVTGASTTAFDRETFLATASVGAARSGLADLPFPETHPWVVGVLAVATDLWVGIDPRSPDSTAPDGLTEWWWLHPDEGAIATVLMPSSFRPTSVSPATGFVAGIRTDSLGAQGAEVWRFDPELGLGR
jgi:hypothetical protein